MTHPEGAARRVTSGAAAEHALHHKDVVVPINQFRQFKNLETEIESLKVEIEEAEKAYHDIVNGSLSAERQQDEQVRMSDIEKGREALAKLKELQAQKEEKETEKKRVAAHIDKSKEDQETPA